MGHFSGPPGTPLAIALEGSIVATTWTQVEPDEADGSRFSALVPEAAIRMTDPRYEVWEIVPLDGQPSLRPTTLSASISYRIVVTDGKEEVVSDAGSRWQLDDEIITGSVRFDSTQFVGWAIDLRTNRPAKTALVFLDGEILDQVPLDRPCPAAGHAVASNGSEDCGFAFVVSYGVLGTPDPQRLTFVALGRDRGSRLAYEELFKQ